MLQVAGHPPSRTDLNSVIMEFIVKEGFKDAAVEFQRETGIDPGLDENVMDQQIRIRKAVEAGNIQMAVEAVNQLDPEILDTNSQLFFHLQLQQLLEYLKEGDVERALEYAQKELSARGEENPQFLAELEQSLALFAYEDPTKCPFAELLQYSQRLKVVSELNLAVLSSQSEEGSTRLSSLLRLLLWTQQQLDKKNIHYPKLPSLTGATLPDQHQQQ